MNHKEMINRAIHHNFYNRGIIIIKCNSCNYEEQYNIGKITINEINDILITNGWHIIDIDGKRKYYCERCNND